MLGEPENASDLAVVDTGRALRVAPTTVTFPGTETVLKFSFTVDVDLLPPVHGRPTLTVRISLRT